MTTDVGTGPAMPVEEAANKPPRVFISHSSPDKAFVSDLAAHLKFLHITVWYDAWEIAVGDSIVEKVFQGIDRSDTLLVVLSRASVGSKWVREELNTAVMRRISERNIRILPVVIEDCEIPTPLRHIRYADFRHHHEQGLADLVDALSPGHLMWPSLHRLYEQLCILCDTLANASLEEPVADKLTALDRLLESAVDLRTEIEWRRARQASQDLNLFEKIGVLAEKGVDVRSKPWDAIVALRSFMVHKIRNEQVILRHVADRLRDHGTTDDYHEAVRRATQDLKEVMRRLCFDSPRVRANVERLSWSDGLTRPILTPVQPVNQPCPGPVGSSGSSTVANSSGCAASSRHVFLARASIPNANSPASTG